ncbi:MAG: protein-L-isoaspartate(D-aspartate) O-methyltransferase [Gammaproteobacteria bacterium]|nr:protein-L-isoaspartate(D-aspartate) O-methyltransferase [Gammaproteobacteria bacterium]
MNSRLLGIGMTSSRTRERMLRRLQEQGIADERVLQAMRKAPRHIFVDEALGSRAYEDSALPIGFGQTISRPYTVAKMTELVLAIQPRSVLEVGTGSGYQTAVLAQVMEQVYTVERILALQQRARERLAELGMRNVRYKHDDGQTGWPQHAPYDAILVAAASPEVPIPLLQQLAMHGRLIMPTGDATHQVLSLVVRTPEGFEQQTLSAASFVPLVHGVKS